MLPRLYATTLIMLFDVLAATAIAGPHTVPAAPADCAPSCERTIHINKVHVIPEQHATTVPSLKLREVATTVPIMDLKVDFKEEKRIVLVTVVKPRVEDRVVTTTTMIPETHIDPCTKCQTTTYKPLCVTKIVKETVMDCVQEPREVIVKVPCVTPVESAVVVKQFAVDAITVPAVVTTYRVLTIPSTLSVPVPPRPILPPSCGHPAH